MQKLTLEYFFDPLCGWCYGFSPVIKKFYKKFRNRLDVDVISGGMIRGPRIGPLAKSADFIKQVYPVIEQRTGVVFGDAFKKELEKGDHLLNSIPPSRALTAFKKFRQHDAILMAHEIQKSIYYYGNPPIAVNAYIDLAKKFELNVDDFREELLSEKNRQETEDDFQKAMSHGVQGFPSVLLKKEDEGILISRGYLDYDDFLMNVINGAASLGEEFP